MRKSLLIICFICLIALCLCCLTACNSDDKGYVLPSGTEAESLSIILPESRAEYFVVGEEFTALERALKSQTKLDKTKVVFNVGKESQNYHAIYSVNITTKKQFLKKPKTYSVTVGVEGTKTDMYGKVSDYSDRDKISITNYNGTASAELLALVSKIAQREDAKYSKTKYDDIKQAFIDADYTITEKEFNDNVISDSGHAYLNTAKDVEGFSAVNGEDWIRVILCKTTETAYEYTINRTQGGNVLRVYYGGTANAYTIINNLSNNA